MNYSPRKIIYHLAFVFAAVLPISCFKSVTVSNIVYQDNFDGYTHTGLEVSGWYSNGGFGLISDTRIRDFNGENVLGQLNNNLVHLNLQNLPSHDALRVEFDLYLHNKWNNDLWHLSIDGSDQLITGFSNDTTIKQSYPEWLGNGVGPAGRNAQETLLPGTCSYISSTRGTSRYRIISTVQHSANSFTLNCNDAGGAFNDTCQRSWSIDNLKVTVFKN